jgi:flagellar basal body rod protein FlgF
MAEQIPDKGRRVTIDLTPAATREVDRLKNLTKLTTADIFRHAMGLFRVYVEAKEQGLEMRIVDPKSIKAETRLELPISI